MAYRTDEPALHERREQLWRELEDCKKQRARAEAVAARQASLEAELRGIEARLQNPQKSLLDSIAIASPCKQSWDDMVGDERVRFCGACAKNVYDLSAMTREEAEALLRANEGGSACVRLARRWDGTVVTNDCPVGARKKKRVRLAVVTAASAGALVAAAAYGEQRTVMGGIHPVPVLGSASPVYAVGTASVPLPPAPPAPSQEK